MKRISVAVGADHIDSLARARKPLLAVIELIWNALDADAKKVSVILTPNGLTGLDAIQVEDNGVGIAPKEFDAGFGQLGDSWKKRTERTKILGRVLHGKKGILRGPFSFLVDQARIMNPVLVPLCLAGLGWFFTKEGKVLRVIGIAASFVILLLLGLQAKNYYASSVYPILFASGAVFLERLSVHRVWIRVAYPLCIIVSGCALAPLVMPILSPREFLSYHHLWHDFTPVVFEDRPERPLPQYFSDEFGWEAMAQTTSQTFHHLSPQEQTNTAIFANDYGQAAAIDFFGPRYDLPASISNAETYWLWGPRQYDGRSVIVLGSDGRGDRKHFSSVEAAGEVKDKYSRDDERFSIFMCRGVNPPLKTLWPHIKSW